MKVQKCSVNARRSFQKGSRVAVWALLLFLSLDSPGRSHLLLSTAASYYWGEVWCLIPIFPCVLGLVSSEALLPLNTTETFLNQKTVTFDFSLNFATEWACGFTISSVDDRKPHCSPEIFSHQKQFNSSYSMYCFCFSFI